MYYGLEPGQIQRYYDYDYNSILGIKYVLSLGDTLGTAGGRPFATPVFPSGCPTVTPAACVIAPLDGIDQVAYTEDFAAYLYPNPYQDNTIIHVEASQYADYSIMIYDVLGHLIVLKNISTATSFDIPLSGLDFSAGMYLIQVSDLRSNVTLKLIKF